MSIKSIDNPPTASQRTKPLSECQQLTQNAKAFVKTTEKLALVEQLHLVENKLLDPSTESPTGCFDRVLREQMDRVARKLIYLTTIGAPTQKYQKAVIFDCSELKELICKGYSADDTAHTLEFLDVVQVIPLRVTDKLRANVDTGYKTTQLDFYTGDTEAMHGGEPLQKLKLQTNGTLDFRFVDSKKDQVLFAIAKGKGDRLYRKYVWVIRKSS
ncbi:hypothetical protein [Altericista sp. CCNU0014]|uniref:hypothetical protein n=1 Tax=Altericista sp. CCNU0014 TaxID=3082949 RepID=UPI00384B8BBD